MQITRRQSLRTLAFAGLAAMLFAGPSRAALPTLSAEQIVDRNATARGGLSAWRGVKTLSWKGKMTAGGSTYPVVVKGKLETRERPEAELPYTFEFMRPNKTRLELEFNGTKSVQVFDGRQGWKVRPYLGRDQAEAFTADELKQTEDEPGIDGYLLDHAAHGAKVALDGTEVVENRPCYVLKVTSKTGRARRVWVDGQTFLEARIEGNPRKLDGRPHAVDIYPRDYRAERGLVMAHRLETVVRGARGHEQIIIDSVVVNPPLDDARFAKPAP